MYPLGIGERFYDRTTWLATVLKPVIADWAEKNKRSLVAITKIVGIAFVSYFCIGYIQTEALSLRDNVSFLGELGEFFGLILIIPAVLMGFNSGLVMEHVAQVPVVASSIAMVAGIFLLPVTTALALFTLCISVRTVVYLLKNY